MEGIQAFTIKSDVSCGDFVNAFYQAKEASFYSKFTELYHDFVNDFLCIY